MPEFIRKTTRYPNGKVVIEQFQVVDEQFTETEIFDLLSTKVNTIKSSNSHVEEEKASQNQNLSKVSQADNHKIFIKAVVALKNNVDRDRENNEAQRQILIRDLQIQLQQIEINFLKGSHTNLLEGNSDEGKNRAR